MKNLNIEIENVIEGSYPFKTLIKYRFDRTVVIAYVVNRLTCSKAMNLNNTMMPFGETGRGRALTC